MTAQAPHRTADEVLKEKAAIVVAAARTRGLTIITAESCTAGRLAATLTDAPGASEVVHGGFVTYTEACKEALGVPPELVARHGPVSDAVARLMAEAALARSPADVSIAVTGVAGPTRDDDNNPVGLVYLAASRRGEPTEIVKKDFGDMEREAVLFNTIEVALDLLDAVINGVAAPRAAAG
jgi:nicotinamide-nucleotide amidase